MGATFGTEHARAAGAIGMPKDSNRPTPPRQFRLSTLFVVVSAVAVFAALAGVGIRHEAQRRYAIEMVGDLGGSYSDRHGGRSVDLANTDAGDDALAALRALSDVHVLYLQGTNITNTGLADVEVHTDLRTLNLANTRISDEGVRHLESLDELVVLSLDGTDVSDDAIEAIGQLSRLEYLYLQNTRVTWQGVRRLAKLPDLEELWLDGTSVSGINAADVARFPRLTKLSVRKTKIDKQVIEQLRARLPRLQILYDE